MFLDNAQRGIEEDKTYIETKSFVYTCEKKWIVLLYLRFYTCFFIETYFQMSNVIGWKTKNIFWLFINFVY